MRIASPSGERRRARAAALLGAALLAGAILDACHTGPAPGAYAPALSPRGHAVWLQLRAAAASAAGRRELEGELLAAADSAILVHDSEGRITLVRWDAVRAGRTLPAGQLIQGARRPTDEQLLDWQLRSRFPQGLTPPLLDRLLAEHRQPALTVVGP